MHVAVVGRRGCKEGNGSVSREAQTALGVQSSVEYASSQDLGENTRVFPGVWSRLAMGDQCGSISPLFVEIFSVWV